jgi:hypothetical protein
VERVRESCEPGRLLCCAAAVASPLLSFSCSLCVGAQTVSNDLPSIAGSTACKACRLLPGADESAVGRRCFGRSAPRVYGQCVFTRPTVDAQRGMRMVRESAGQVLGLMVCCCMQIYSTWPVDGFIATSQKGVHGPTFSMHLSTTSLVCRLAGTDGSSMRGCHYGHACLI